MSLRPKLFYASQSIEDPKITNMIQVRQMVAAFATHCDVTVAVRAGPGGVQWPEGVEVVRLPVERSRLGNWLSGLTAYRQFRPRAGEFNFVYSRNPVFSICCGRREPSIIHAFEAHHFIPGWLAGNIQRFLYGRSDLVVAISNSLGERIRAFLPEMRLRTLVAHDAHGNPIREKFDERLPERPHVGYFGKLIASKGRAFLPQLFRAAPEFDFSVYSPSRDALPALSNLVDYRHLPHGEIHERMCAMDFLLLPVIPQDNDRDFTAYTSPLKLFEYMSAGGVIIASDQPVLREVLTHGDNAWLVPNQVEAWRQALVDLAGNPDLRRRLSRGATHAAREATWGRRAEIILARMQQQSNRGCTTSLC